MDNLLTTAEAAERLGLHPKTLAGWRSERAGPAWVRLGGAVRYRQSDLEAYVASRAEPAAAAKEEPDASR